MDQPGPPSEATEAHCSLADVTSSPLWTPDFCTRSAGGNEEGKSTMSAVYTVGVSSVKLKIPVPHLWVAPKDEGHCGIFSSLTDITEREYKQVGGSCVRGAQEEAQPRVLSGQGANCLYLGVLIWQAKMTSKKSLSHSMSDNAPVCLPRWRKSAAKSRL